MERNSINNMSAASKPDVQIDLQKWFSKILSFWWLFVLGLVLAVPAGQLYLRYATPLYSAKAKLLIEGVGSSGGFSEAGILASELGINSGGKNMDNEIQILTSRPIITKTIQKLKANVTYYRQGRIKSSELYEQSPLLLNDYQLKGNKERFSFYVNMGYYDDFDFMIDEDGKSEKQKLSVPFVNEFGSFHISRNEAGKFVPGIYQVNIMSVDDVANSYTKKIECRISRVTKAIEYFGVAID